MLLLSNRFLIAAPIAACALITSSTSAQQTLGTITGTITDASGAAIAGAQVTITSAGTNLTFNAASKTNGEFAFQNLPIGTYAVQVVKAGFRTENYPNIMVQENRNVTLNTQLMTGQVS